MNFAEACQHLKCQFEAAVAELQIAVGEVVMASMTDVEGEYGFGEII